MSGENELSQLLDDGLATDEAVAQPTPGPAPAQTGVGEQATATPADATSGEDDSPTIPRKALLDERRKRQDLENKIAALERQMLERQSPPPQPSAPPDWMMEPENAAAAMRREFENRDFATRVTLSERFVRDKHPDYAEAEAAFMEVAQADDGLRQQLFQHPFPAEFAYITGKRLKLMKEIGDNPDDFRSKIEAEIKARYGITDDGQSPPRTQNPRAPAPVPKSLAKAASAQPRAPNGQFANGPTPLEDIIG